jgi:outer membrane protein
LPGPQAIARRPEFEAVRQQLANDETSIRLAHNNLLPNLLLTGTYSGNGLNNTDGLGESLSQAFGFGFPSYGVGVTLTLPIKNRAAKADLGAARVSQRHDLYQQRQLHEFITLDVSNAVHQLEQAKLSMAAAKISRDLAQKNLEAEQRKYELGTETIFFVLDAQTKLAQAELDLLQAQVGYQVAVASVNHATGGLLEHYHVKIAELTR